MRRLVWTAVAVLTMLIGLVPQSRNALATDAISRSGQAMTAGSTLSLPGPTGRHSVGTVSLHLVDATRRDPWVPSHPLRELMVQLWYPAGRTAGFARAPYIPALAGQRLDAEMAQALNTPVPAGTFHALRTHSYQGAPVAKTPKGRPVILFSPGDGMDRSSLTNLAEDLAGHGYVVAGIDDTHDSGEVEFPGGRVEVAQPGVLENPDEDTLVRTADARFVLDQITRLNTGADPDVDRQRLPAFRHTLDLSRVGMFGHSHGAEATAETMLQDQRITAGAELDGGVSERVVAAGLHVPFMVVSGNSSAGHPRTEENLTALWPNLTGWNRWLRLRDAGHLTFTDFEVFAPELHAPPATQQFGTIDPARAVTTERAYLLAFFTQQLGDHHQRLLDRPSPRYPDIIFER